MNTYNPFISHSCTYSDAYDKLVTLLYNRPYFEYKNYSVPKDDPMHTDGTDEKLYGAIRDKLVFCNVVIILAGVYSSYRKRIDKEIKIAEELKKPIIAVEPWGSERTSKIVKEHANRIVKWNTESLVCAIKDLA